ncbi:hypothetical protein HY213_00405 [Candidatus Peregrinibacteria bacterium]|nr:hypothetical protein [Candidatus Peregrinibacteria bacterium]
MINRIPMATHNPIDLAEPLLVATEGLPSPASSHASMNNQMIRSVFRKTEKSFPSPQAQIGRLLVTVRWPILELTRRAFVRKAGIGLASYMNLENGRPLENTHRDILARVLAFWRKQGIVREIREQLLELLQEEHGGLGGFYQRLMYEVGPERFTAFSGIDLQKLSHHKARATVPPYLTVQSIVQKLFGGRNRDDALHATRLHQGQNAWSNEKRQQLRERTLEETLADFLIALEIHVAEEHGKILAGPLLWKKLGMNQQAANDLMNGKLVPWDVVQHLAHSVLPEERRRALAVAWNDAWKTEQGRITFEKEFHHVRELRHIQLAELAYAQDIRDSKDRGKSHAIERKQNYRKSAAIRRSIREGGFFDQACIRTQIGLVAGDEETEKRLLELFFLERERHYRRSGSDTSGIGLRLRISRECNGTTPIQVAEELCRKHPSDASRLATRLARIEWGYIPEEETHRKEIAGMLRAIDAIGYQKLASARSRQRRPGVIPEHCLHAATVREAAALPAEGLRGFRHLSDRVRENASDVRWMLGPGRLRRIASGEDCPPLPLVRTMLEACGTSLSEEVMADWFVHFPLHLQSRRRLPLTKPLPRLLLTLIHAHAITIGDFCRERIPDMHQATALQTIQRLERGERPHWHYLSQILTAAEESPRSLAWNLAQALYENNDDVAKALKHVRLLLRKQHLNVHPFHLPGLTPEELGYDAATLPSFTTDHARR